jgi:dienelactone hydrolase
MVLRIFIGGGRGRGQSIGNRGRVYDPGIAASATPPMKRLAILLVLTPALGAQTPLEEQKKLAREYLSADAADARKLEPEIAKVPALSKSDAQAWTDWVRKQLRTLGPKLDAKGTNWFYDKENKETKRGKYIVSDSDNKKGLVFGLHGGGVGQADCGGAASAWRSAIGKAGMIGIYPEAVEATEAAWGDDVTVKFILDLLAAAQRTFTFDPDRVYVVGHSMGGYGAWTWGGRFSDRLAAVVSFAGAPTPIFDEGKKVTGIQPGVLPNLYNVPIWVYHSADDPQVPIAPTRFSVTELRSLAAANPGAYVFRYEEEEKQGHAFPPKGPNPALAWMAEKKRNPLPKKIVWQAFYDLPDQSSYWLACEEPVRASTLQGSWDGKTAFQVTGDVKEGAVSVLLNDAMCDLDKPVTVTIGGKATTAVRPRSLAVLLKSARRRWDPNLLFTATGR